VYPLLKVFNCSEANVVEENRCFLLSDWFAETVNQPFSKVYAHFLFCSSSTAGAGCVVTTQPERDPETATD